LQRQKTQRSSEGKKELSTLEKGTHQRARNKEGPSATGGDFVSARVEEGEELGEEER